MQVTLCVRVEALANADMALANELLRKFAENAETPQREPLLIACPPLGQELQGFCLALQDL